MIGATSKRRKTTVFKTPGGPEQKFFGTFFSKK
jgi:hypothetical protein